MALAPFADRMFRRRRDYHAVFGSASGKRVLADLFAFARVSEPAHVPGDSHTTAFNDGQRRVALRIAAILAMSDADIMRLAMEQTDDE